MCRPISVGPRVAGSPEEGSDGPVWRQGLALGAPGVTWGTVLFKNLLPVTLGNAAAGALLVACSYSLAYGALGRRLSGGK